jgi:hypothetical protein
MRVLFPGIEDHPVLRELEVMLVSLAHPHSKDAVGSRGGSQEITD